MQPGTASLLVAVLVLFFAIVLVTLARVRPDPAPQVWTCGEIDEPAEPWQPLYVDTCRDIRPRSDTRSTYRLVRSVVHSGVLCCGWR